MNTMSIANIDRAISIMDGAIDAIEATLPAAPSALATAKQAVVQVVTRNPVAAYVAAGAVIGIGGTILAIQHGPTAIRFVRNRANSAMAWAAGQLTRTAPTATEFPAPKAPSNEEAAPAAA
jgi:hypothetical protein